MCASSEGPSSSDIAWARGELVTGVFLSFVSVSRMVSMRGSAFGGNGVSYLESRCEYLSTGRTYLKWKKLPKFGHERVLGLFLWQRARGEVYGMYIISPSIALKHANVCG